MLITQTMESPQLASASFSSTSSMMNQVVPDSPASSTASCDSAINLPAGQSTTTTARTPRRLVKRTSGSYRSSFMDFGADPAELSLRSLLELDALPKAATPIHSGPSTTFVSSPRRPNTNTEGGSDNQVNVVSLHKQIHHRMLYYFSALVPRSSTSKGALSLWSSIRVSSRRQRRRARTASVAVGGSSAAASGPAAAMKKKRPGRNPEETLGIYQLERVAHDAVLRDGLADRLLQEHRRDSCMGLRFISAVADFEKTHGWRRRHQKSKKIIALFVSRNARFRIVQAKAAGVDRYQLARGRFSQHTFLVKLKSTVMLDLLKDPVVQQYLSELRDQSFASQRFANSNVMSVEEDEDNEEGFEGDEDEGDMEIEIV